MITIELEYFSLSQICDSGQCFRMRKLEQNRYAVIAADKYLEITQEGTIVTFHCSEEEFLFFWVLYFDLDTDYSAFISAINPRDHYLSRAADFGWGIRILHQDLWEMIVSFLISQQNNIRRIRRCIENICQAYGAHLYTPDGGEYYAFPTPEALAQATEEELKEYNLGYRAKYVLQAAQDVCSGKISLEKIACIKQYKRAKKALLDIYGVGEKVADCICLFALHHMDAFPVDTHIHQVLEAHYKRGFPNRRYRGIRGVLQQYIFYYELKSGQENTGNGV